MTRPKKKKKKEKKEEEEKKKRSTTKAAIQPGFASLEPDTETETPGMAAG